MKARAPSKTEKSAECGQCVRTVSADVGTDSEALARAMADHYDACPSTPPGFAADLRASIARREAARRERREGGYRP